MPSHNRRGKAAAKEGKEKKAARFGGGHSQHHGGSRHSHSHTHGHGGGNSTSSSSNNNGHHASRKHKHTFDDADPFDRQLFDYIVVIDVEATCEENHKHYPHEIIELPGVLIDVRKGLVDRERSFHTYVRPVRNPTLTPFCRQLTGITQAQVDAAPPIAEAVRLFEEWFVRTIPRGAKVALAADGPWDLRQFVYEHHVLRDGVGFPTIFYEYLDIRTTFLNSRMGAADERGGRGRRLEDLLRRAGLRFEGRPHCGFDDAYNIARLAVAMMRGGCVFDFLVCLPLDGDACHHTLPGWPLYRRQEGSGRLDPDVVDDIAKKAFGADFFAFGERHRAETAAYRALHPHLFANRTAVARSRRALAAAGRGRQRRGAWAAVRACLMLLCVALLLAMLGPLVAQRLRGPAAGAGEAKETLAARGGANHSVGGGEVGSAAAEPAAAP